MFKSSGQLRQTTDAGKSKFLPLPLTEQKAALLAVEEDHSVLRLGRQVEGEARPGEPRLRWRNPSCHIGHNVLAAFESQDAFNTISSLKIPDKTS